METETAEAGCPSCGVLSGAVHPRLVQRLGDVGFNGPVPVLWAQEALALRGVGVPWPSFRAHRGCPTRTRMTTRLTAPSATRSPARVRAVDRVAVGHGLSWPTVACLLAAAAETRWRPARSGHTEPWVSMSTGSVRCTGSATTPELSLDPPTLEVGERVGT